MKTFFKWPVYMAFSALISTSIVACSDSDGDDSNLLIKENMLQSAMTPYVNKTVIPTYKAMADAAIDMYDKCVAMQEAHTAGNLTTDMIKAAGEAWNTSRKYWELSEAFLFGAAADYNIDPHIDSWPLDKTAMDNMLNNAGQMAQMSPEYVGNNLGYGLLGFHAVEYMLFQLDASETQSLPHNLTYTKEEMIYLTSVAGDLRNQCVRLEASWAGLDNVSSEKQEILEEAELEPTFDYGSSMINAGKGGSKYVNYQDAAEEIIQGCIDIADEVGNTKIGRPVNGSSTEDKNYIESPYSLNSIVDFTDNIISIQNAYTGSNAGDASISDYIQHIDPTLDAELKAAIEKSIATIKKIPEPFAKTATTNADAKTAVTVVGTDLVNVLGKVMTALSKY
ncbi:imelysin family protein [Bacteroides thetaiotaomicron]|uniref:imelysin family protein n=1 Tax=Bacteroides thetaiotaomicron TaxID=818 RepID=UPI0018A17BE3|nr:imelysin family protein [Bacteroides thetaiotaomicron]MDC2162772.1 imelysin family protein [Bacteroides thetaiotaomicron]MDC2232546.1 imelysin family protein [Bacteroides thetaiotaomicron]